MGGPCQAGTRATVTRLDRLDPSNQALRYSGHLTARVRDVDVGRLACLLRDTFDNIRVGVPGVLDAREAAHREMIGAGLY